MINANDSVNNHFKVHRSASLLDVLIEFDKFLDDLNVYSYENWLDGEIVDGPHLTSIKRSTYVSNEKIQQAENVYW